MSPVFSVFLVAVTVGSFGMQALRIRRHGAAGVSRSTWMGLLVSVTLWSVYGIAVRDWTITATNIPLVVVATLIMVAMVRDGAAHRYDVPAAVGGTLAACAVAVPTIGPDAVGAAAATIVVARIVPQLVTAVRADDVTGVSITTWLGNIANKVPWGIYGFLVADIWMTWASVMATALSLAIVLVVVVRRRGAAVLVEVDTEGIPVVGPA